MSDKQSEDKDRNMICVKVIISHLPCMQLSTDILRRCALGPPYGMAKQEDDQGRVMQHVWLPGVGAWHGPYHCHTHLQLYVWLTTCVNTGKHKYFVWCTTCV